MNVSPIASFPRMLISLAIAKWAWHMCNFYRYIVIFTYTFLEFCFCELHRTWLDKATLGQLMAGCRHTISITWTIVYHDLWRNIKFTKTSSWIYFFQYLVLWMCLAKERRRYNVTSSLIGWAHSQNDPCFASSSCCSGVKPQGFINSFVCLRIVLECERMRPW